jgi:hypothetical protein
MELTPALNYLAALAQVAAEPAVDGAYVARVASRIVHILCALILGGGLFYMRLVLSPAGPQACFGERRAVWARWVGGATLLLLASGLFNFVVILGQVKEAGGKLPPSYHMLFGVKFLLGLLVMFIAAILAGKTTAADRFRGNMGAWLNIAVAAVVAIVIIGAVLRTYH